MDKETRAIVQRQLAKTVARQLQIQARIIEMLINGEDLTMDICTEVLAAQNSRMIVSDILEGEDDEQTPETSGQEARTS